jgi:hypothetical protein
MCADGFRNGREAAFHQSPRRLFSPQRLCQKAAQQR